MSSSSLANKQNRKSIGIVWLTVFIDLVGFSIIFPLFPSMLEWYLPREGTESMLGHLISFLDSMTAGTDSQFLVAVLFGGILGSLYSLLQFVASPFWGRMSDVYGRKRILTITTIGTAFAYAIWIFSGSFLLLIISRVIGGIMAGNIAVATASIADLTDTKNRSKGMALIGVAFGLGFILGPAIGGLGSLVKLSDSFNASASFALTPFSFPAIVALALSLLNVFWVIFVFKETNLDKTPNPERRRFLKLGTGIPNVQRAIKVYFVFLFAFSGMEFTLTFLALERLNYSPRDMTMIFVFIGLVLAFTQGYFVRKYSSKIGERNFVIIGLLSGFLGLVFLSVAMTTTFFYVGLALLGIGIGCSSPSLTALVSLYSSNKEQGKQLGAFRSAGSLARAFGPLTAALVFWSFGSQVAYVTGAIIVLFSVLLSIFLPKPGAQA